MYRTAEPIEEGSWQVGAGTAVGTISDEEQDTGAPTAQSELLVRYGVDDDLDVGAKLFVPGLELNATWRLFHGSKWSWALLPSVSIASTPETGLNPSASYAFANVGLVTSRRLSPNWALGFGGSVGAGGYRPETGGTAGGVWLGTFAHMDYRLSQRWHFTPELGGYSVIMGEVPVTGAAIHMGAAFRIDL